MIVSKHIYAYSRFTMFHSYLSRQDHSYHNYYHVGLYMKLPGHKCELNTVEVTLNVVFGFVTLDYSAVGCKR